jgi:DNA-directed RNA polymerase subunit F
MSKFRTLVRELDAETLDELRRQVAAEVEQRRKKTAIRLEDIHPRMGAEAKVRAAEEIARVLEERRG